MNIDIHMHQLGVLGLTHDPGSISPVKVAYRARMLETHPDKGGSSDAFREVSEAYAALVVHYNRKRLDEERDAAKATTTTKKKEEAEGRKRKFDVHMEAIVAKKRQLEADMEAIAAEREALAANNRQLETKVKVLKALNDAIANLKQLREKAASEGFFIGTRQCNKYEFLKNDIVKLTITTTSVPSGNILLSFRNTNGIAVQKQMGALPRGFAAMLQPPPASAEHQCKQATQKQVVRLPKLADGPWTEIWGCYYYDLYNGWVLMDIVVKGVMVGAYRAGVTEFREHQRATEDEIHIASAQVVKATADCESLGV